MSAKFKKISIIILALVLFGLLYIFLFGSPIRQFQLSSLVKEHVEEMEGTSDIQQTKAEYEMKRGDFYINVVFENEPDLEYGYLYNDRYDEIRLFRIIDSESGQKINEGKNDSLKHY